MPSPEESKRNDEYAQRMRKIYGRLAAALTIETDELGDSAPFNADSTTSSPQND